MSERVRFILTLHAYYARDGQADVWVDAKVRGGKAEWYCVRDGYAEDNGDCVHIAAVKEWLAEQEKPE